MRLFIYVFTILMCMSSNAYASTLTKIDVMDGVIKAKVVLTFDKAPEYKSLERKNGVRLFFTRDIKIMPESLDTVNDKIKRIDIIHTDKSSSVDISTQVGYEVEIIGSPNKIIANIIPVKEHKNATDFPVIDDISLNEVEGINTLTIVGKNLLRSRAFVTAGQRDLVIDFLHGKNMTGKNHMSFPSSYVRDVTIGESRLKTRVVINTLSHNGITYKTEKKSDEFKIIFGKALSKTNTVESVRFKSKDRIARVIIEADSVSPYLHMEEHDGFYVVEFKNAKLSNGVRTSMDVSDFPGPVSSISTRVRGHDVQIKINTREVSVARTFQSGNLVTITLQPKDMLDAQSADQGLPVYSGEKITLEASNMDIRDALNVIADASKLNMVINSDVSGTLNMRLIDVPWDQALDIILTDNGLSKETVGNVMRIASYAKLKQDIARRGEAKNNREMVSPLETEFFVLGYANISDIRKILMGSVDGGVASQGAQQQNGSKSKLAAMPSGSMDSSIKFLSSRGSILMDERTNTLVITDTRERLVNISRLLHALDKPTQQVMIEAHIVEASEAFARDVGVRWGGAYNNLTGGGPFTHGLTGQPGGNVVDLGAAVGPGQGGLIGYTLGTISGRFNLNLELSAAESNGDIKVISDPHILTSNLKIAKIEETTDIPFTQTTFAGGVSTASTISKLAKLTLEVKPQITQDGSVSMKITINKDTPIKNTLSGNGQPIIDKKQVTTTLLVRSGDIAVIGGIKSTERSKTVNAVPFLSKIPLLGLAFKKNSMIIKKRELIIFIRPIIVSKPHKQEKEADWGGSAIDNKVGVSGGA